MNLEELNEKEYRIYLKQQELKERQIENKKLISKLGQELRKHPKSRKINILHLNNRSLGQVINQIIRDRDEIVELRAKLIKMNKD